MSQKEYTKDTEKGIAGAETHYKDVDKNVFILEKLLPTLLMDILYGFCLGMILFSAIDSYSTEYFIISDYILSKRFLYKMVWLLIVFFITSLWYKRKEYHLMKKKPFASISNEKLTLNFGKDSFLWDHIQSVDLESERKLIVVFKDNGKRKKRTADLKWLSRKKDFIDKSKNNCVTQGIRYRESEMTLSSRVGLFLRSYSMGN